MAGVLSMSGKNEINTKKRDFDQDAANWDQVLRA
jgi:hypothetical protein